ncbi:hypothetical protein Tco_0455077 [Tanacetum coccineum]
MVEFTVICYYMLSTHGIQVRSNRGFCFGFVEFEAPDAVQKAIEIAVGAAVAIALTAYRTYTNKKRRATSGSLSQSFLGWEWPHMIKAIHFDQMYWKNLALRLEKGKISREEVAKICVAALDSPRSWTISSGRGLDLGEKVREGCGNFDSGGRGFNRGGDFGIPRGEWESARCLIDQEREREQIDQALLKNVLDIFVEIGMGRPDGIL